MKWKYTYFVFLFLFLSFVFISPYFSQSTRANLQTTTITTMMPMNLLDALLLNKGFQLYGVNDYHKLVVFDTRTLALEDEYNLGYDIKECKLLLYHESKIIIVSKIPLGYENTYMIIQSFDLSNHKVSYIGNVTDFLPKNYRDVVLFDNTLVYVANTNQLVYYSLTKHNLDFSGIFFEKYQNTFAYSPINHTMLTFNYPPANLSFVSLETNVLIKNITWGLRVIPRILCSYLNSSNQFAVILEPMYEYDKNVMLIMDTNGNISLNITYETYSNLTDTVNSEIFEYMHNYYFITTTGLIYRINSINDSFEAIGETGLGYFTIKKILVNEPLKQVFLVTIGSLYVYYFDSNILSSVLYPLVQNTYFANEISVPEVLIITSTIVVFSILFVTLFRRIKMK